MKSKHKIVEEDYYIDSEEFPIKMNRIHWADGEVSDMVNRTRAKDAVRIYEERQLRVNLKGPVVALGSSLVRLND